MPTYEYVCLKCEKEFEVFQSMKDPHLKLCPGDQCEAKGKDRGKVKRKLGRGAGIIFKGSGFYETDYRSESYKQSAEADKKSASESTKASSDEKSTAKPKAESKPETKSESKPKSKGKKASS